MRRTTCRLLRLFLATDCEASQHKDSISVVLLESSACRVRIRVITTSNNLLRMRGLAFRLEIFEKGAVSRIEMRGLAIMDKSTKLHSMCIPFDAVLLYGRPYTPRRHL